MSKTSTTKWTGPLMLTFFVGCALSMGMRYLMPHSYAREEVVFLSISISIIAALVDHYMCGEYSRVMTFGLMFIGVLSNGLVVLSNGGKMPVAPWIAEGIGKLGDRWVVATADHRFIWLSDQWTRIGFSVGDMFILGGMSMFYLLMLRSIVVKK